MTQQIAATILANETYLKIFRTTKKMIASINKSIGLTPNTTPALVATALPPWNFK